MKQTVLSPLYTRSASPLTDFQGWRVPSQFDDPAEEYHAVRNAAGLFDVGYLGRIEATGPGAEAALQKHFTRDIAAITEGSAVFGLLCNETGGIIDAVLLYRLAAGDKAPRFLVTTGPSASERVRKALTMAAESGATVTDTTERTAQFALQGPRSDAILEAASGSSFKRLKAKRLKEIKINGVHVLVSRTGFTGERGYELFLQAPAAEGIWTALLEAGKPYGLLPCGLTCREMLRIEAGYALSGNELNETRTPAEAGLLSVVDPNAPFLGRDAVARAKTAPQSVSLVGFEIFDKGIPRQGAVIFSEIKEIGVVTSGIHSIARRKDVGLGYVLSRYDQPGQEIEVEIKDREAAAKIIHLPMYRKK